MKSKRLGRYLVIALLAAWGVVTIAALGGMYKLWWDRERVNYSGKTVDEQRLAVWKNSGLSEVLLGVNDKVQADWPRYISYSATGDHNQLSYLKYLLIPRIPAGSDIYSIDANGSFAPAGIQDEQVAPPQPKRFSFTGFVVSFLAVSGMTLVLQRSILSIPFSFPEMFGCASLFLMGCVVVSRALFATAVPAFYLLAATGLLSWIALAIGKVRSKADISRCSINCGCHADVVVRRRSFKLLLNTLLIGILALSVLWVLLMSVIVVPDDWDAWAIWAAKAKVLALGRGPLFDVSYFGHADYPLLWPSVWAFSGWLGGGWEEMWSRGWAGIFLLLCIWEMVIIIARTTGRKDLGLLGGALFVSMPMTPLIASWSYAETPFWMLTVSCIGSLRLWRSDNSRLPLVVAAVLAAGAAYTKNEGLLFTVLASFWILLTPGKQRLPALVLFASCFFVLYFPWFYWIKIVLKLGSHATAGLHLDHENFLRIADRIPKAVESIFGMWSEIKRWNIVLWVTCVYAVFGCVKKGYRTDLMLPLGMLLGYLVIVVFHNDDIYWQIGTSWDRLTVQTMPLLLIVLVPHTWKLLISATGGEDISGSGSGAALYL